MLYLTIAVMVLVKTTAWFAYKYYWENRRYKEAMESARLTGSLIVSQRKFEQLTENLPLMFLTLNKELEITSFNKVCQVFTGFRAADVVGKKVSFLGAGFNDFTMMSAYYEVIESGEPKNFIEEPVFNEKRYTVYITIYALVDGVGVLLNDITEQKRAERQTADLIENLKERNRNLQQFSYIVSHNLRAPIAKIEGLANLFDNEDASNPLNATLMGNVAAETSKLDNIVQDINLIIAARDPQGEQNTYVSFEDQVKLVGQTLEKEIQDSKTIINTDFEQIKGINSYRGYIHSIVYNLVSNAIKYRDITKQQSTITITARHAGRFACLSVADNGVGIDLDKDGKQIFSLYKRFHSNLASGRGIGLNLVKTHAETLGGMVKVKSTVGQGTTFNVYLPL